MRDLHREGPTPAGEGAEVGGVAEGAGERDRRRRPLQRAAGLHAGDVRVPRVEVAENLAGVLLGHEDLETDDGLQEDRARLRGAPPEGAHASYFVGSTTPRGHMLPSVIGAFRLQKWALAMGANAVVVDPTGLVDKAQGGKALKQWKIELLAPDVVIGLYREQELEPILWPLRRDRRVRCIELPASPHALARPRESRIARRRERLVFA